MTSSLDSKSETETETLTSHRLPSVRLVHPRLAGVPGAQRSRVEWRHGGAFKIRRNPECQELCFGDAAHVVGGDDAERVDWTTEAQNGSSTTDLHPALNTLAALASLILSSAHQLLDSGAPQDARLDVPAGAVRLVVFSFVLYAGLAALGGLVRALRWLLLGLLDVRWMVRVVWWAVRWLFTS